MIRNDLSSVALSVRLVLAAGLGQAAGSMARQSPLRFQRLLLLLPIMIALTWWLAVSEHPLRPLWPSLISLAVVFGTRRVLPGLLLGAGSGALLLASGHPGDAVVRLVQVQLLPIFSSEWKLSAIGFTLLLGGFVALTEATRGLQDLLHAILRGRRESVRGVQTSVAGFGLLVFFDGLANTMLVGRLMRSAVDRVGVSREKLAYLADATGSAVACLAFVSTWIAFQLSMIREGYAAVGLEAEAYRLFFQSLPMNFYCWFALVMVAVCILRDFNPGAMGQVEKEARSAPKKESSREPKESGHWLSAVVPVAVLVVSVPLSAYLMGTATPWPLTPASFAEAYAAAEAQVPKILVLSAVVASLVAALSLVLHRKRSGAASTPSLARIYLGGVRELLGPIGILFAAWMLGSAMSELGAGQAISELLSDRVSPALIPLLVFLTGALISFTTGTSWGTMAILMPLVIPVIHELGDGVMDERLVMACIGGVFSGAVFGDHCSPFSDTTLVASMAAGVKPIDHVRTQLPFALWTAGAAALVGFLPLGFGLSPLFSLIAGAALLFLLPTVLRGRGSD